MGEVRRSSDPFDFPPSIVPPGMTYQWCAKTIMGEPNESYAKFIAAGWMPVPICRHPSVFSGADEKGNVVVGGCALLWRPIEQSEEARNIEMDKAHTNAVATFRIVSHPISEFVLDASDMQMAQMLGISCAELARRRANAIAEGRDKRSMIVGDGASGRFKFARQPRPRHQWLRWLFDLISTEAS